MKINKTDHLHSDACAEFQVSLDRFGVICRLTGEYIEGELQKKGWKEYMGKQERTFAIGDIHAHEEELNRLIVKIENEAGFNPEKDHLVLCGDIVDVGPNAKGVIEWCIRFKEQYPDTFHPLRGNHDDMMIDALRHDSEKYGDKSIWLTQGGNQTLVSYRENGSNVLSVPKAHLDFLESLPLYYWPEESDYFFCHAGIPPEPLSQFDQDDPQTQRDLLWIRERFIDSKIDFGRKIIFAHTPQIDEDQTKKDGKYAFVPIVQHNKIGLNTMPRNEGYLTCIELPREIMYFQPKL